MLPTGIAAYGIPREKDDEPKRRSMQNLQVSQNESPAGTVQDSPNNYQDFIRILLPVSTTHLFFST
jgi:hypothetical protein